LTAHSALTSTFIPHQVRYSNVCVVRDEEAAGSNPTAPTRAKILSGIIRLRSLDTLRVMRSREIFDAFAKLFKGPFELLEIFFIN
jgi:hypothetical protein